MIPGHFRALSSQTWYVLKGVEYCGNLLITVIELRKSNMLFYKPYPYFVQDGDISDSPGDFQIEGIEALYRGRRYNDVRRLSADFIKHTLAGLRYLET